MLPNEKDRVLTTGKVEIKPEPKPVQAQEKATEASSAVSDTLKALGITPTEAAKIIEQRQSQLEQMDYDLGPNYLEPIMVNGNPVPRKGSASRGEIELYQMMLGNRHMRRLREAVGQDNDIKMLQGGGFIAVPKGSTGGM
jgi:hypothetical protein